MFVLPLGLGTKLRRIPYVTLALAAVWIYVFAVDRSEQEISEGLFSAVAKTGVRDAARRLFVEYCQGQNGKISNCEKYAVLVWTGFPAKQTKRYRNLDLSERDMDRLDAEHAQAQRLRDKFGDCGHSRSCFSYKDIIWSFTEEHNRRASTLTQLPGYAAYKQAERGYVTELRRLCAHSQCLVKGNITPASLLMSQVRHGGLLHLFGNMVALLLFGVYAEQRTNRGIYLAILLIGGSVGMFVHTNFFSDNDTIALGGSANVSAVMGMFYVFFFQSRMRFLVWLPRKVYIGSWFFAEVKYCFPLFFLLADVAGGLDNGFSALMTPKVAHMAHLSGFAVGAALAWLVTQAKKLPRHLIYEGEEADLDQLVSQRSIGEQLRFATTMLSRNPENMAAREITCTSILNLGPQAKLGIGARTLLETDHFLVSHLATVCAVHNRRGTLAAGCQLLDRLPLSVPLKHYLARLGQGSILSLGDFAVNASHWMLALRLYDLFLQRFPLSVKYGTVDGYAGDIIARMPASSENIATIALFVKNHEASPLAPRLGAWLMNVNARIAV